MAFLSELKSQLNKVFFHFLLKATEKPVNIQYICPIKVALFCFPNWAVPYNFLVTSRLVTRGDGIRAHIGNFPQAMLAVHWEIPNRNAQLQCILFGKFLNLKRAFDVTIRDSTVKNNAPNVLQLRACYPCVYLFKL